MDELSLWQFAAAVDGWNRAQKGGGEKPDAMSDGEFDELLRQYEARHGA